MPWKFNPFTGELDFVTSENFSYETIASGNTVTVEANQQMIVYDSIVIDGTLSVEGQVVVSTFKNPQVVIETNITETIKIDCYDVIRQTASGITTSLQDPKTGSKITITNRSGGSNTLNITVQGVASPTIRDKESFSLIYNGTDYDFT